MRIEEFGHDWALKGLSLSYQTNKDMQDVAYKLYHKGGGHNNFLSQITVYMEFSASQTFWLQFDRYHFVEKQSESKMHTIMKQPITQAMFTENVNQQTIEILEKLRLSGNKVELLSNLPMSFKQARVIRTNYLQLRTMYQQRKNHQLVEWKEFCKNLEDMLERPQYLK